MRVVCKHDYELIDKLIFEKDHYYEVFIEYNDSFWIQPDGEPFNVMKFYKKDYIKNSYNSDIFENYFSKLSEERKQKLNNLNKLNENF